MTTEIFTLCDSANDYNGKLVIVGTFNNIFAQSFPAIHQAFTIVAKMAFDKEEIDGNHLFRIYIRNSDEEISLLDTGHQNLILAHRAGNKIYSNIIFNVNNIMLPNDGEYTVNLEVDNKLASQTYLSIIELPHNIN